MPQAISISAGFSPCPNDTHIFYGCVQNASQPALKWDPFIADVEALNTKAFSGALDVTKLSIHAYAHVAHLYEILDAGSALGYGCGPLLIGREKHVPESLSNLVCGHPGKYTTAYLLCRIALPQIQFFEEMIFHEIEQKLEQHQIDIGVIIHESRFTYQRHGLVCCFDFGAWWEKTMNLPLPLGCIAVKRSLPQELKEQIARDLSASVTFAFHHPEQTRPWVKQWSQSLENEVIDAHIGLYVNMYTRSLGDTGKLAIEKIIQLGSEKAVFQPITHKIFTH